MSSDSSPPQSTQHHHAHGHDHGHEHGHVHDHSHEVGGGQASEQVTDLKSPVLIGVFQRLFWTAVALAGLWSVVFWALYAHE
jgi:hypothetical protein